MLLPEQGRATIYRSKSLSMNDVFEGGWFVPKSHGESDLYDFYNDGIAVSAMTAHNIHGDLLVSVQKFDDRQYIIATNVFSGPESILGHELAGDKSIVVAGTGDQPIRDGSARADVALNDIAGVDFSPNHDAIWIADLMGAFIDSMAIIYGNTSKTHASNKQPTWASMQYRTHATMIYVYGEFILPKDLDYAQKKVSCCIHCLQKVQISLHVAMDLGSIQRPMQCVSLLQIQTMPQTQTILQFARTFH